MLDCKMIPKLKWKWEVIIDVFKLTYMKRWTNIKKFKNFFSSFHKIIVSVSKLTKYWKKWDERQIALIDIESKLQTKYSQI